MNVFERRCSYLVIWEFEVRRGQQTKFEAMYGPNGGWADLFRRSEDYMGTELSRDLQNPLRYVTLDFWTTQQAYQSFRARHADEYSALDAACEELTEKEAEVGAFTRILE